MDRQTAIDRITETENLTDGLEDDDANWLLDWGIAQVDGLVTGIKDEVAAGEKLNQLMSVMRTLNQIAADRTAKAPDALAGDIRTFLQRYQQAFGAPNGAAPTAAPTPATDGQAAPTGSQTASKPSTPGATSPKDKQDQSAPPTKKGGAASTTPPTSPSPSSATPSASPANTTASGAAQTSQGQKQIAQAASKIAGMSPKEAMQFLLSLAEADAPGA
jgi:hypothetical protein